MCDDLEGSGIVGGKRRSNKKVQQGRKLAKYNKLRKNGYSKSEARAAVFGSIPSRKKRSIKGKGLVGGKFSRRQDGVALLKKIEAALGDEDGSPDLYDYDLDGECASRSRYGRYTDLGDGEGCIPIERAYKNYKRSLENYYDAPKDADYEILKKHRAKTSSGKQAQIKRNMKKRMLMKRLGLKSDDDYLALMDVVKPLQAQAQAKSGEA